MYQTSPGQHTSQPRVPVDRFPWARTQQSVILDQSTAADCGNPRAHRRCRNLLELEESPPRANACPAQKLLAGRWVAFVFSPQQQTFEGQRGEDRQRGGGGGSFDVWLAIHHPDSTSQVSIALSVVITPLTEVPIALTTLPLAKHIEHCFPPRCNTANPRGLFTFNVSRGAEGFLIFRQRGRGQGWPEWLRWAKRGHM